MLRSTTMESSVSAASASVAKERCTHSSSVAVPAASAVKHSSRSSSLVIMERLLSQCEQRTAQRFDGAELHAANSAFLLTHNNANLACRKPFHEAQEHDVALLLGQRAQRLMQLIQRDAPHQLVFRARAGTVVDMSCPIAIEREHLFGTAKAIDERIVCQTKEPSREGGAGVRAEPIDALPGLEEHCGGQVLRIGWVAHFQAGIQIDPVEVQGIQNAKRVGVASNGARDQRGLRLVGWQCPLRSP